MSTALIAAAAVASLLLAAGPAAAAARGYVARLAAPSASGNPPRVRRSWILERRPQAVVALVLTGPVVWRGGVSGALADTVVALPLVAVLGVACCVDAVSHRLPDRLLGWAALWLIVTTTLRLGTGTVLGAAAGEALWPAAHAALRPVARAMIAAAGIGLVMVIMTLLPSGMGLGDAKLSALCALWLGQLSAEAPFMGIILSSFIGGLAALVLLVLRRASWKTPMAYGPHLGAGAWLTWLLVVA